jgi:hypothetical protein
MEKIVTKTIEVRVYCCDSCERELDPNELAKCKCCSQQLCNKCRIYRWHNTLCPGCFDYLAIDLAVEEQEKLDAINVLTGQLAILQHQNRTTLLERIRGMQSP